MGLGDQGSEFHAFVMVVQFLFGVRVFGILLSVEQILAYGWSRSYIVQRGFIRAWSIGLDDWCWRSNLLLLSLR